MKVDGEGEIKIDGVNQGGGDGSSGIEKVIDNGLNGDWTGWTADAPGGSTITSDSDRVRFLVPGGSNPQPSLTYDTIIDSFEFLEIECFFDRRVQNAATKMAIRLEDDASNYLEMVQALHANGSTKEFWILSNMFADSYYGLAYDDFWGRMTLREREGQSEVEWLIANLAQSIAVPRTWSHYRRETVTLTLPLTLKVVTSSWNNNGQDYDISRLTVRKG